VLVDVCLGGFAGEMRGVEKVGVGDVRVMRGFFVSTGVVVFRGFHVMACRVFVMLRRFPMMLCCLLGHEVSFVCRVRVLGLHNRQITRLRAAAAVFYCTLLQSAEGA
jgi:hypothetical protein